MDSLCAERRGERAAAKVVDINPGAEQNEATSFALSEIDDPAKTAKLVSRDGESSPGHARYR